MPHDLGRVLLVGAGPGPVDLMTVRDVAVVALGDAHGVAQHGDRAQGRADEHHPRRPLPGGDDGGGDVEPLEVAQRAQPLGLAVAPHVEGDHGVAVGPQLVRHGDHGGVVTTPADPMDEHDGGCGRLGREPGVRDQVQAVGGPQHQRLDVAWHELTPVPRNASGSGCRGCASTA